MTVKSFVFSTRNTAITKTSFLSLLATRHGPCGHNADGRPVQPSHPYTLHPSGGCSFSRRLFAAFRLSGSPAYREAIDISCRTAYRSLPSVWYSIRFSISVNSIRIPPDSIHQKKSQHYTVAKKWQQKKPDSKNIVYYQAVTAGIRNAARSRFIFRLTLICLFLQPCDLLCLFQGLTFKQRKPANADVYGIFQTPRVGLEPTTPRLTAACSTNGCGRTPKNSIILINLYFIIY